MPDTTDYAATASAPSKPKGYTFHGGADALTVGDKTYQPGDVVPCSEAQALQLRESAGIIFEELGQRYSDSVSAELPLNR